MRDAEFAACGPADLAAYLAAWKRREQREDFRTATIVCTVANLFLKEGAKPIEPGDVFPSLPRAPRGVDPDRLASKIKAVASSFGAASEVGG